MGATVQCYVDLSFQGRLRGGDELYRAEIAFFSEQIEAHGFDVFSVSIYCQIESVYVDSKGLTWLIILLKTRGIWTRLYVEVRSPDVLVLYDRRQGPT